MVRSFNRYGKNPGKALGRVHELLAERHSLAPAAIIDGPALAAALSDLVALQPWQFRFWANFCQRGLKPYFRAYVGAEANAEGNDAAAVVTQVVAQLKANKA